ncbi:MAG TPA: DUF1207 domain-containing protein [Longimicrobiales bacterium]|nr:DUF1207 domain-containing protein [Longimicrobiales bacterium]
MNALALIIAAQLLPAGGLVRGGLADLREPRDAIGLITTTLLADPLAQRPGQRFDPSHDYSGDTQGVAQLGINIPILRVGPFTTSLQSGVISRFRMEVSSNDALSIDYEVGFPVNYKHGNYEARVRFMHRSAHVGDEVILHEGIRRLNFDREEINALVARRFGGLRAYLGGTKTIAGTFDDIDRHGIQAGADAEWPVTRGFSARAGVDWQRHTLSQGSATIAAVTGISYKGKAGVLSVDLLYSDGATQLGEFFPDRERYWGGRLVFRELVRGKDD